MRLLCAVLCSLVLLTACVQSSSRPHSSVQPYSGSMPIRNQTSRVQEDQLRQVIDQQIMGKCTFRISPRALAQSCLSLDLEVEGNVHIVLVTYSGPNVCVYDMKFTGVMPHTQEVVGSRGYMPQEGGGLPIPEMCIGSRFIFRVAQGL